MHVPVLVAGCGVHRRPTPLASRPPRVTPRAGIEIGPAVARRSESGAGKRVDDKPRGLRESPQLTQAPRVGSPVRFCGVCRCWELLLLGVLRGAGSRSSDPRLLEERPSPSRSAAAGRSCVARLSDTTALGLRERLRGGTGGYRDGPLIDEGKRERAPHHRRPHRAPRPKPESRPRPRPHPRTCAPCPTPHDPRRPRHWDPRPNAALGPVPRPA